MLEVRGRIDRGDQRADAALHGLRQRAQETLDLRDRRFARGGNVATGGNGGLGDSNQRRVHDPTLQQLVRWSNQ